MGESKSELKRMCVTNPLEMAEELASLRQQLAAEARIKASQEQEPFGYWHVGSSEDECDFFLATSGDVSCADCIPLFAQPPIPPDLAELQRENAELRKELESPESDLDMATRPNG